MPRAEATVTQLVAPRDPFDFPATTDKVSYLGVDYNFRELTVAEIDEARDMATDGEKFDGRLMTRLMICTAATEPKMSLEQLAKLPQGLYNAIVDKVNRLNDPDVLAEGEPGNS
jgi:hypothetical protein